MKVQRYKCKNASCDYDQQENIPFATGSRSYTHRLATYVVGLLKAMTLKDSANLLNITWDTVKDIHMNYLERHYSSPSLKDVDCIGIDEFAVRKGHVYKTIVVDLRSGRIIYVGEGKLVIFALVVTSSVATTEFINRVLHVLCYAAIMNVC